MAHLDLNDSGGDPTSTAIWGEHITDEEYTA